MVLELFDGGVVLISDPKTGRQFKVNGHRLKPYLTSEPPAPADKVNLHLPEHSRTSRYHPRPISSLGFILFSLAEDVKLSTLGRHPKIILPFSFLFFYFSFLLDVEELHQERAHLHRKSHEHHGLMSFSKPISPHFFLFSCHDSMSFHMSM